MMSKPLVSSRDKARKSVLFAIRGERDWQAARISDRQDDAQIETDLLFLVGVLSKYQGQIAAEGVEQSQAKEVDWEAVAKGCVKMAAVAAAVAESLVANEKVSPKIIHADNMHA